MPTTVDTLKQLNGISWTTPNRDNTRSHPFTLRGTECHLQFYRGSAHYGSDYHLYLHTSCRPEEPLDLSVHVVIGRDAVSHCRTNHAASHNLIWRGRIKEISKVVPDFRNREFLFEITVHDSHRRGVAADKFVQTPTYLDTKFELENLSRDFAKLLQDEDSSHRDVELVCGDRSLKAHSSLLSARSDVFRAMLQSDMVEGKTGRVVIPDVAADLFNEFLQYLYTGRLPDLTVEHAMRLYEIGDRYSVSGIKERCASFLTDNLSRDHACAILSLADQHNDPGLKESAISFVLDEKIPLHQECWSDFCKARPQLAIEVYDRFTKLHVPELVFSSDSAKMN